VSVSILDRIVAEKRAELANEPASLSLLLQKAAAAPPPRDFAAALRFSPGLAVIAELKRASPSAGVIAPGVDLIAQAQRYEAGGAAAISVLTDTPFFHGSLTDLQQVRTSVDVPLLRKDFILDPRQVLAARAAGADACLLIAEILDDQQLTSLCRCVAEWGMTALVECHEAVNLRRVIDCGASVIGINNRNLRDFTVRLEHTLELAPLIPADRILVSESGIQSRADAAKLAAAGVRAVLVGEALMRSADPIRMLAELSSAVNR
jgi:indole-3-glycerol phosphate synthase